MRIYTDKGWLEPLTYDHAQQWFELIHASRNQLHAWLPWLQRVHSTADTARFIERLIAERGPQYVITVDWRICGGIGFHLLNKARGFAHIGYWLGNDFVGQGIMRDAVMHLCRYGFMQMGLAKIEIRCADQNTKSRQIAEGLDFYLEGIEAKAEWVAGRYLDHAVYSMLPAEFALLYPAEMENKPLELRPRWG